METSNVRQAAMMHLNSIVSVRPSHIFQTPDLQTNNIFSHQAWTEIIILELFSDFRATEDTNEKETTIHGEDVCLTSKIMIWAQEKHC